MITEDNVRDLIDEVRVAQIEFVNGTFDPLFDISEGTIFAPMGGGAFGGPGLTELSAAMCARFHDGTTELEVVQTIVADNVVCLVLVERNRVRFDDEVEHSPWILRVTMIFRRDEDRWTMVHRHADPCIDHRGLEGTRALFG
jgi:hypothetical protein